MHPEPLSFLHRVRHSLVATTIAGSAALPPLALATSTLPRADACFADIPQVSDLVSSCLDGSLLLTPLQAATRGSPRLLDRVLTRVMNDPAVDPAFRTHWLARAIEIAIEKNDLAMVQQIHHAHPARLNVHSLKLALQYGSLELVLWIVDNRNDRRCGDAGLEKLCPKCLVAALPSQFQEPNPERVLDWLLAMGLTIDQFQGIRHDPGVLQWLDERGELETNSPLLWAIETERDYVSLDAIRFWIDRGTAIPEDDVIISLVRGSCQPQHEARIDLVVVSRLCDSFRDKFTWAPIRPGGAKVLQWDVAFMNEPLSGGRFSIPGMINFYAAHFCHADTLAWFHSVRNDEPAEVPARKPAKESDLLAVYQWMHDTGKGSWSGIDEICAARKGFLSVIQWLDEHKPELLTPRTINAAAEQGHLSIAQWLSEKRNFECTAEAVISAPENGHVDLVQWVMTNSAVAKTNDVMRAAAVGGHLELLEWLHANCVDACNACVLRAAIRDPKSVVAGLDSLRWLTNHNTFASSCIGQCLTPPRQHQKVATAALHNGQVDFARFLLEHHRPSFVIEPINMVARSGHLPALQWLYANAPELVDWQSMLQSAQDAGNTKTEIIEWLTQVTANAQ